jgi:hypothetical protein
MQTSFFQSGLTDNLRLTFDSNHKTVPSRSGLTVWSSRHQQATLVGSLRAAHSGAAYRGR